jgi:hypothetical protein
MPPWRPLSQWAASCSAAPPPNLHQHPPPAAPMPAPTPANLAAAIRELEALLSTMPMHFIEAKTAITARITDLKHALTLSKPIGTRIDATRAFVKQCHDRHDAALVALTSARSAVEETELALAEGMSVLSALLQLERARRLGVHPTVLAAAFAPPSALKPRAPAAPTKRTKLVGKQRPPAQAAQQARRHITVKGSRMPAKHIPTQAQQETILLEQTRLHGVPSILIPNSPEAMSDGSMGTGPGRL